MKKNFKIFRVIFIISLLSLTVISCTSTKYYKRPAGNVEALNTAGDEFAPVQHIFNNEDCSPCAKEFKAGINRKNDGVKLSKDWLKDLLGSDIELNPDAVTFIKFNFGFFTIPHPPDEESARKLGVDVEGIIGGTDLFEFYNAGGRFAFKNLGKPINSIFWDSQPTAASDDSCNILLVWASDRNDLGGYSSPFSSIVSEKQEYNYHGNTDLFYCFYHNGKWGEVKNLEGVNTGKNEETPYLYCLCNNPVLFFASDRNGSYDIYTVRLSVDYDNEIIRVKEQAKRLNSNSINTQSKEFYPYVALPINEEGSKNRLYFSSNRNDKEKFITEDTVLQSFGGFDIYSFNLPEDLDCKKPKIHYKVVILDSINPGKPVRAPLFVNLSQNQELSDTADEYLLQPGVKYKISGGSLYDKIDCEPGTDKTIAYYTVRKIKKLEPEIIEKDTVIEVIELVPKIVNESRDTVFTKVKVHKDELISISKNEGKKIYKLEVEGDSVIVTFMKINESNKTEFISEKRKQTVTYYKEIPRWDTSYTKINIDSPAYSEKTKRNGSIYFANLREDTYVKDTIFIWPRYYIYPPCEWKYDKDEIGYSKNVPYFQTCFWEVNTLKNFRRDLKLLHSRKYADASFIELNTRNQYFGYNRSDLTTEQQEFRKRKYRNRVWQYENYAKKVDENLNRMVKEISEEILPLYRDYDEHSGGMQNKLIVTIKAYSDLRPIIKGTYLGDETVKYITASYDSASNQIVNISKVIISSMSSLEGESNDMLSKLRAFFGYREIINRLKKQDNFKYYYDKGWVLFPDEYNSTEQYKAAFDKAKIIILVEGKQIDLSVKARKMGYVGESDDYTVYDPVRRIDVDIRRVEWDGVKFIRPQCCKPTK